MKVVESPRGQVVAPACAEAQRSLLPGKAHLSPGPERISDIFHGTGPALASVLLIWWMSCGGGMSK